jgi:chromosome segregation ATPase
VNVPDILVNVLAWGGGAGLVGIIMLIPQLRKLGADTRQVDISTHVAEMDGALRVSGEARALMQMATDRARAAEAEAASCRTEVAAMRKRVEELERLIGQLQHEVHSRDEELLALRRPPTERTRNSDPPTT